MNSGFVGNREQWPRNWIDTSVRAKMDLQEVGCGGVWTGSSWLRIGTGGGLF